MHVLIVGGGAGGSLMALAVLRRSPSARVTVVDRDGAFGRGLAYGAAVASHHRINAPAVKMGGLTPEDEDGFVRWLTAEGRALEPFDASFVPRAWFGDYLVAQLRAAARAEGRLALRTGAVTSLARQGEGWRAEGPALRIDADRVVLCPGNPPPRRVDPLAQGARWVGDVWRPGALDGIASHASVVVLGTGATAIDAVIELAERGHTGPVTMVSRRGLLPRVDVPPGTYPDFFDPVSEDRSLRAVFRRLRTEARVGAARGVPWQNVLDAFRFHGSTVWQGLDEAEQRRFIRHGRAWWMVHRHRLAPDVSARLAAWLASGWLAVRAARVRSALVTPDGCELQVQRTGTAPEPMAADWVLNCIGPSEEFSRIDDPLWRDLFDRGVVRPGPLGLGVDVDKSLRLRDRTGRSHDHLFAVGLPTRGVFWEVTAVTHIRRQAAALVEHLFPA